MRAQDETAEESQHGAGSDEPGGDAAESPEILRGPRHKTWHREKQFRRNQARALEKQKLEDEDFAFREAEAIKQAHEDLAMALAKVLTAGADAKQQRLYQRLVELGHDYEQVVAEMAKEALAARPG